jgi:hypothetical protein
MRKDALRICLRPQALIERGVRQLLADKVSGSLVRIWLLVPEHLRSGTWDLALQWTGRSASTLEPRQVLQLIHESARDLKAHVKTL